MLVNPRPLPCEEAAIRAVDPQADCGRRAKRATLTAAILGSTLAFVDGSVVNVALPAIEADLRAGAAAVQWLVSAYQLSLAALLLVGGAAGDRFGRRRIFAIGVGLFAAASLWCGLVSGAGELIVARAAQGVGAALLVPSSLALIGAVFDEHERGKAIGTWAAFSALAAAIGPILGGFIVDHATWHWIFLINPMLALPTLWLALRLVPESRDAQAPRRLDWPGAILAFAGLGCAVYALITAASRGWTHLSTGGMAALGVVLLGVFIAVEARSAAPMMPLSLFRSRVFSGVNLLTLLLYAALGGAFFFLPFDLVQVHGYSVTQAGAVFLPFTIIMAALSRWSGGLIERLGARTPLVVGPAVAAVGYALLALSGRDGAFWLSFLLPIALVGLGMAIAVAPLTTVVINAVPAHRVGVASGVNNAVASAANLFAVAVLGAVGLAAYGNGIETRLAALDAPAEVKQVMEDARGSFVAPASLSALPAAQQAVARAAIADSLSGGIRLVMLLSCALALAAAVCGAATAPPRASPPKR
jgi:EmrB/QacA subfamily drug resistance transporter